MITEHEVYGRMLDQLDQFGWGQHTFGVTKPVCIMGHAYYAIHGIPRCEPLGGENRRLVSKVVQRLMKLTGRSPLGYNDVPGRTKEEMVAIVRKAYEQTAPSPSVREEDIMIPRRGRFRWWRRRHDAHEFYLKT